MNILKIIFEIIVNVVIYQVLKTYSFFVGRSNFTYIEKELRKVLGAEVYLPRREAYLEHSQTSTMEGFFCKKS